MTAETATSVLLLDRLAEDSILITVVDRAVA
jgi:hypothetical protein